MPEYITKERAMDCVYEAVKATDANAQDLYAIRRRIANEPGIGWVSVKDRMPETRHAVLAFSPHHNNIWALCLHEDRNWYYWMDVGRRYYDPDWMGPITHWMPLTEPPEEVNGE